LQAGSRKQQIVETVLELVAAHGIESVSAQRVADAIGLSQPTVFRHFSTKEALWLAVMDWLEQRLIAIHPVTDDEVDEPGLVVLSRLFLEHVKFIGRYPALSKLYFSDYLRQQYPSVQARFAGIHKAYVARLSVVIDRAKSDGVVPPTLPSKDAATTFVSLLQGLGFRVAIARLPITLEPEAEQVLSLYLRAVTAPADASAFARGVIGIAKELPKPRQ
jgi:AcrR family transcriptional regulator